MKIPNTGTIVVLTGAGISKESGLSTFRDADGIWATVRIEDVATPDAFRRDPDRVHAFYNARRRRLLSEEVHANSAHAALDRLEIEWPGEVLIVTQNIDDLHERAGSRNVIHMHGDMLKARCAPCGHVVAWRDYLPEFLPTPHPSWRTTGWLKRSPWFEAELVPDLWRRVKKMLAA